MPKLRKSDLLDQLSDALRRHSGATVLFHAAVAERAGLGQADHKCLDLLIQSGPKSAGELAAHTGLTTGAITGVIDRLERAGYAARRQDPGDRRKVVVEPIVENAMRELGPLFMEIAKATNQMLESYSVQELTVILDFVKRTEQMLVLQAEAMKQR